MKNVDKAIASLGLTDWASELNSKSESEINKIRLECQGKMYQIDKTQDEDEALNIAKENVKDLSSGYKDAKKIENVKIHYAIQLLQSRKEGT